MAGINTLAVVKYNGFTFPHALRFHIESEPVQSGTTFVTKYHRHRIQIEFILHKGMSGFADNQHLTWEQGVESMRARLLKQNGLLTLKGVGAGISSFQADGDKPLDIVYGPTPKKLDIQPLANCAAYVVTWVVEITTPECHDFSVARGIEIVDYHHSVEHDIDENGYTTITRTGVLEIAGRFRLNVDPTTNTIVDRYPRTNADKLRTFITFPVIKGFRRSSQKYTLSDDRRYLNFTIVDQEIHSRYPFATGITNITARQRLHTKNLTAGINWQNTLTATVTLEPDEPKTTGYAVIARLIRSRRKAAALGKRVYNPDESTPSLTETIPATIVTRDFSIDDDIYGNDLTVTITWDLFVQAKDAFKAAGLFVDPDTENEYTWSKFATRQYNKLSPRGRANIEHQPNGDIAAHFCEPSTYPTNVDQWNPLKPASPNYSSSADYSDASEVGKYLQLKTNYTTTEETNAVYHQPLKGTGTYTRDESSFESNDPTISNTSSSSGVDATATPITQNRSETQFEATYSGMTTRLGKPIPRPNLLTADGIPLKPIGKVYFNQRIVRTTPDGIPIYGAVWKMQYVYTKQPHGKILLPHNPTMMS